MNRRDFLKIAGLTPLAGMMPEILTANSPQNPLNFSEKIVVLIELRGGNDALNTLIPYSDPEYYRLRPNIGIKEYDLLKLRDGMGMHSSLRPLQSYWHRGQLAWIQGLGYDNPNRSHFRSREIWATASHNKQYADRGWVSQLFTGSDQINGVSISEALGPLAGKDTRNLRIGSLEGFIRRSERMQKTQQYSNNSALNHILRTEHEVLRSAADLRQRLDKTRSLDGYFPNNALGQKLSSVARLISSGINIPAYKVGLGDFDTHAKQQGRHAGLLDILAKNLDSFAKTMQRVGKWQDVIVVTYSEFGRKAQENSSHGTDHGLAAAHLVMGGAVKGGQIYGKAPSLTHLNNGSMQHTQDFRSVYSTLAQHWWKKPSLWKHPPISFV